MRVDFLPEGAKPYPVVPDARRRYNAVPYPADRFEQKFGMATAIPAGGASSFNAAEARRLLEAEIPDEVSVELEGVLDVLHNSPEYAEIRLGDLERVAGTALGSVREAGRPAAFKAWTLLYTDEEVAAIVAHASSVHHINGLVDFLMRRAAVQAIRDKNVEAARAFCQLSGENVLAESDALDLMRLIELEEALSHPNRKMLSVYEALLHSLLGLDDGDMYGQ